MIPRKLKLVHWCQHEDLEMVFVPGLNMLRGGNGAGKSNIIDALLMALTCESNNCIRKTDKKTDNITEGRTESRIILEFEHQGTAGAITVDLRRNYTKTSEILAREIAMAKEKLARSEEDPSIEIDDETLTLCSFRPTEKVTSKLKWGDLKLTKSRDVLEWVAENTGVTPKVIKESYFPRQGDVDTLISGDPEARYRSLAAQAGVLLAQGIHRELSKEMGSQPSFDGAESELRAAELRLADAEGSLRIAEAGVESAARLPTNTEEVQGRILLFRQSSEARKQLVDNEVRCQQLEAERARAEKELQNQVQLGTDAKQENDTCQKAHEDAKVLLSRYEAEQRTIAERRRQQAQADQAKEWLKNNFQTDCPYEEEDREADHVKITKLQSEVDQARLWLGKFGTGVCPTCHQEILDAEKLLEETKAALAKKVPLLEELESTYKNMMSALADWQEEDREFRSKQSAMSNQLKTAEERLLELPRVEDPATDEQVAEAKKAESAYKSSQEKLEAARRAWTAAAHQKELAEKELSVVKGMIEQASKNIDGAPDKKEFDELTAQLLELQSNQQAQRDADRVLAGEKARVEVAQQEVDRCKQRLDRARPTMEWVSLLSMTRDLFHRNGLPRDAVLWYAKQLIDHTNYFLEEFDNDFRMSMGDDMSFLAVFPDKVMPSHKLSGGERNMLSNSLRFANTDLYPSQLSLMELDEIEVHLDGNNVEKLPKLLDKVKVTALDRSLVVLFISHHPALADIADHVSDI